MTKRATAKPVCAVKGCDKRPWNKTGACQTHFAEFLTHHPRFGEGRWTCSRCGLEIKKPEQLMSACPERSIDPHFRKGVRGV